MSKNKMSIIYSRPRIKMPKLFIINKSKQYSKVRKILFVFFLIFLIIGIILGAVTPVFNQLCKNEAKSKAIIITNEESKKAIKDYYYSDFIIIHKDDTGNVLMLEANMVNINNVISDISTKIQKKINDSKAEDIKISLGTFTGVSILAGRGYSIPIRISTIGNIDTNVRSEFVSEGINQTIHRLYLDIECEINILTPFNTVSDKIKNQIVIAENIIVGNIPETYYNLEGVTKDDTLNMMQ